MLLVVLVALKSYLVIIFSVSIEAVTSNEITEVRNEKILIGFVMLILKLPADIKCWLDINRATQEYLAHPTCINTHTHIFLMLTVS